MFLCAVQFVLVIGAIGLACYTATQVFQLTAGVGPSGRGSWANLHAAVVLYVLPLPNCVKISQDIAGQTAMEKGIKQAAIGLWLVLFYCFLTESLGD